MSGSMGGSGQPQAPGAGNAAPEGQGQMPGGQEGQPVAHPDARARGPAPA